MRHGLSKPTFRDTCAIRMSVALLTSGVVLPGARMKANEGAIRGRRIEPGQGKLSAILRRVWGKPEVYKGEQAARDGIGRRHGVVSFFRVHGGGPADGGHIDLVQRGPSGFSECTRSCYFSAGEVWFWPLS
ncbi:MAG: T6SS effector amidase Tae4 family protein [Telluria sp.]